MPALSILHVTPYAGEAWGYGGIPRVAAALTRGLAHRGHRVTVCATDACDASGRLTSGHAERTARAGGAGASGEPRPRERRSAPDAGAPPHHVDLRVFPNVSNRLAYRWQLFLPLGLARYLRAHAGDFDVAHLHGCHHLPGVIASRHLRRAGVPYVLSPHGTGGRIERRRLAKALFDGTVGRGVMAGAARIAAVSEAERRQLLGLGVPPERIAVVSNPIDLAGLAPAPDRGWLRRRFALGPGPVVMYLGTLTPRKRVDVLVRAVARLGRPDGRLVIAGNDLGAGPGIRRLVRRLHLEPVTTFTGLLRGADRFRALADADVVVYPGRDEVFGLVPLEALLCGRPVIVADDSGCGEVIGRVGGGLVVPQGDVPALAQAIRSMLAAPDRWEPAICAAAARVRERYADGAVCAEVEDLYATLLAARPAQRVGA